MVPIEALIRAHSHLHRTFSVTLCNTTPQRLNWDTRLPFPYLKKKRKKKEKKRKEKPHNFLHRSTQMVSALAEGSRHPGTSEETRPPWCQPETGPWHSVCPSAWPLCRKRTSEVLQGNLRHGTEWGVWRGSRGLRAFQLSLWLLGNPYQAWEMWPPFLYGSTRSCGPWGGSEKEVSSGRH